MVKRAGFSLVEVIVAMVLLSIALLGIAATALLAARTLMQGELRERAARQSASVLDSLIATRGSSADVRDFGTYRIAWSADSLHVQVRTTFTDGSGFSLEGRR